MKVLSSVELRRFGLTVGGVFLALGVLLVVPGVVAPRVLGPVQRVWMRAAGVMGEVNSRIILTVMFYGVFAPLGFVMRRLRDPLDRSWRDGRESTWIRRPPEPPDRARYERQF